MDALASQLQAHGFLRSGSLADPAVAQRALHAMLERHHEHVSQREELNGRLRTADYDQERLQTFLDRALHAKAASERDRETEKAKALAATRELATETERLRATRDDLQKAKTALQYIRTQAQYDQRRRERELTTTLQKWQRLAGSPSIHAPGRMALKSPLPPSSGISDDSRGEVQLLEDSLGDLEASRQALLSENTDLRVTLSSLDTELRSLLNSVGLTTSDAPEHCAALPPALLGKQVESLLSQLVENINERLDTYMADQAAAIQQQSQLHASEEANAALQARLADAQADLELAREELSRSEAALAASLAQQQRMKESASQRDEALALAQKKRARKAAKAETLAVETARAVLSAAPAPQSIAVAVEPLETSAKPVAKAASSSSKAPSALAGILALTDSPSSAPSRDAKASMKGSRAR